MQKHGNISYLIQIYGMFKFECGDNKFYFIIMNNVGNIPSEAYIFGRYDIKGSSEDRKATEKVK